MVANIQVVNSEPLKYINIIRDMEENIKLEQNGENINAPTASGSAATSGL